MDFFSTVTDVHPSLNDSTGMQSISNDTLARLAKTVLALKEEKKQRLHKASPLHFSIGCYGKKSTFSLLRFQKKTKTFVLIEGFYQILILYPLDQSIA
jgi:hypothetical protein